MPKFKLGCYTGGAERWRENGRRACRGTATVTGVNCSFVSSTQYYLLIFFPFQFLNRVEG